MACGQKNYTQYQRMDSFRFKEDTTYINYSPIKAPSEKILIEKKNFHLGEYFLKSQIQKYSFRMKHYNESTGYFKKYLNECIKK